MSNLQKLKNVFSSALNIDENQVEDSLAYRSIPQWDSLSHMAMVAAIERTFDIMLDTEDVLDLSTIGKAKDILKKYGVTFDS